MKIREIEDGIAIEREEGANLSSIHMHRTPDRLLVDFDVRHSSGFTYKNRPFWRTVVGFFAVVILSGFTIEILEYFSLFPSDMPTAVFRIVAQICLAILFTLLFFYRWDYLWCQMCKGMKNSGDSPICHDCRADLELDQVRKLAYAEVQERWSEKNRVWDERKESGTSKTCLYCRGPLSWHDGWRTFTCPNHGTYGMQQDYLRRDEHIHSRDSLAKELAHMKSNS